MTTTPRPPRTRFPSSGSAILALTFLVLPALAEAQQGPPFDPPGPPPGLNPPVGHDRSGVPPGHSHGVLRAPGANPATVTAIASAHGEVQSSLAGGELSATDGRSIAPPSQSALLKVLRDADPSDFGNLVAALSPNDNAGARRQAEDLTTALRRIREEPSSLGDAVQTYNRFIEASSVAFLKHPPGELLAVQAALGTLVDAAFRASEANRASATAEPN